MRCGEVHSKAQQLNWQAKEGRNGRRTEGREEIHISYCYPVLVTREHPETQKKITDIRKSAPDRIPAVDFYRLISSIDSDRDIQYDTSRAAG